MACHCPALLKRSHRGRKRCGFTRWAAAWFAHDEDERGSLEPGKLADLAVLSTDYMNAPLEQIGTTESLMTIVGGKIVYAAGPFAHFEERH